MTSQNEPQKALGHRKEIWCPSCHSCFFIENESSQVPTYCTFCGHSLTGESQRGHDVSKSPTGLTPGWLTTSSPSGSPTLVQGHVPLNEPIQFTIGPYQVLRSIGKGGMGEVFLAYDTNCGRRIALKRIRADLMSHKQLFNRFLKEARVTSQLTHPAIIPIYSIHSEDDLIYYTMPFVEGDTLKQILRHARVLEKKGEKLDHIGGSIPSLVRIFITICQAVAYAHSKGVLHRDLKPENVIIGKYGEVLILDWGLAKLLAPSLSLQEDVPEIPEEELSEEALHPLHQLTNIGKVVGTIAYMAPERAMGKPATIQTDIYALGVMLYQILTLHHPFQRKTLKNFRRTMHQEVLIDPAQVAPYRDVPKVLSRIVEKSLSKGPEQRYHSVDEMIRELENYIEGRSEWFQIAELNNHNKGDWEFQENILIAEHMAITRNPEGADWFSLMISKASFSENMKIEANVSLGSSGKGLGFLLSIPEASERVHLNDGYCLWLGAEHHRSTKLLRSTVEVIAAPDIYLLQGKWYRVSIEKIDNNIHFYLDGTLQFSYISHLPLVGTHIGLLARDADFEIKDFIISVGSQNIMVKCLAVPDAFLAHKDYAIALTEYRRIGYAFPGRAEGREAMFRAGITLLEQGRSLQDNQKATDYYEMALKEFEKLHGTPGAPLEYLGKALVYQAMGEYDEEIKCFELAFRRYPRHPLLPILQEQIVYRMHDSSRQHRLAAYHFILFVVRYLSEVCNLPNVQKLFNNLRKHWEILFFIEDEPAARYSEKIKNLHFGIQLAFWLAKAFIIGELIEDLIEMEEIRPKALGNALFCLIELGAWKLAEAKLKRINMNKEFCDDDEWTRISSSLESAFALHRKQSIEEAMSHLLAIPRQWSDKSDLRIAFYLMEQAISLDKPESVYVLAEHMDEAGLVFEDQLRVNSYRIWALLLEKKWDEAGKLLHSYPLEILNTEGSILHFLYGCWLYVTEIKEIAYIHFYGVLEVAYPRSWTLASHQLKGKIGKDRRWFQKAFMWEKRQLFRQLALFYHCANEEGKAQEYRGLERKESVEETDEV